MKASRKNELVRDDGQPVQRSYIDIVRDTTSSREIWREADFVKYAPAKPDAIEPDRAVGSDCK